MKKSITNSFLASTLAVLFASTSFAQVADFESLTTVLGSKKYWDASGPTATGVFTSGGANFSTKYATSFGGYWASGWAASNVTNTTLAGYDNLYGTYPGQGADNSKNYVVGQQDAIVTFYNTVTVAGLQIANATYAALSMKNGDSFAKKFGGTNGTDPDYFKLRILGFQNGMLNTVSGIDVFLADFRSSVSGEDFILDTWKSVDLSALGAVDSLKFKLYSSDTGKLGINTPLFFNVDNISILGKNVAGFENLELATNSYLNKIEQDIPTGFANGNAYFQSTYAVSNYADGWGNGFIYSTVNNTTLAGYGNQYAAIAGSGYDNSVVYAMSYGTASIQLKNTATISGFYATNATYTYLSMKNGDNFAKKFGGATGIDPDYFKLIVKGFQKGIQKTDTVAFYLADFTNSNNALDYILNTWKWVDLQKLGTVDSLVFSFQSSDAGSYGINTPKYFAMDNFNGVRAIETNTTLALENSASLAVYPNPATETLYVNVENSKNSSFAIINAFGNEVLLKRIDANQSEIDISSLAAGVYFVRNNNGFTRFIKQ
ncbi:MAG: DUF4465 domain-containing protein [Cytophagales bacterium]